MKWLMEPVAVALGIIIVIAALMLFGGFYLKLTQPPLNPTPAPTPVIATAMPTTVPTTIEETIPPTPEITPEPTPTPRTGTYAESATPIRDPNPYVLPYYSTVYNPRGQYIPIIFHQTYDMNYQYEAVYADVKQPPFIIDFAVTPESDSPIRSFFLITVRDNETQKILAQDGFYRTYSSNSPKRLYFSSPGKYHINMYGGFVNADLTLHAPAG